MIHMKIFQQYEKLIFNFFFNIYNADNKINYFDNVKHIKKILMMNWKILIRYKHLTDNVEYIYVLTLYIYI